MDLNTSARKPISLYDEIVGGGSTAIGSKSLYDEIAGGVSFSARTPIGETPASEIAARYEMASPGEIARTVGAVGESVIRTPLQIAGAAASAIRGGSREAIADKNSFLTRIIDRANQDAEEFQKKYAGDKVVLAPLTKLGLPEDITTETITRFPQQAAFSAVSAGAGLTAGVGTAAVSGPAAPVTGRVAGMAASGGAAYRMQKDASTRELYEKLNAASMKTAGRELSPEEWKAAYDKNEGSLVEQGIAEAIPEALGNLVGFELFFGAAKNAFGKQLAKTTIGKALDKAGAGAVGKMLAQQATEQATETWTQQWQHNIDVEMGLKPGETRRSWTSFDDLRQSNREVFADILLLTAVMGGAALAGEHVREKMDTRASARLVKDVVAENKFDSIPNEFLPAIYEHAQELSDKRPKDKELSRARDAFAAEMDRRGIDFDMTSKFKEYLKLDAAVKADEATGDDVARWVSLRDEFKEKNISPDLYQQYLSYQSDIDKAMSLQKLILTGKATEPQRKELIRLIDAIASRAKVLGLPEDNLESSGVGKGGVIRKPPGPAGSAARDILLGGEPEAKRKNLTAKDVLTEGDVDIQSEEDLTPESLSAIDRKLEIAGTPGKRATEGPSASEEEAAKVNVFSRMPLDALQSMADTGVEGAKNELVSRKASTVVELPAAPMEEAVDGGGARSAVETPQTNSARKELDEAVAKYRGEGHDINDHGVYINQERVTVPFSKASGREGEIRIAKTPDGFRFGISISKKYGDMEGGGYAPSIDSPQYKTRAEAIKAGIDEIRSRTKADDSKGERALKDLAGFENTEATGEIKAAGTGGARGPKAAPEAVKATKSGKATNPATAAVEVKTKEEEGKAKLVKKYLLEHIDEAITARTAYENNKTEDAGPDHVIIDVPMDGKFRIWNTVEALQKFKKNVSKLKVTAALNKLPQHSGKPVGKSTDLITKEAEKEVADYWTKRNEFRARYEGVPAEIAAAEARLAKYQEIRRKVDAKEITLKQLGEDAKAAASKESAGSETWRDSWFGKTPTYADLTGRIKEIEREIKGLQDQIPNLEARIREFYPSLAKEMFETKAAAKEKNTPEEITAAGTGGARGPKAEQGKEKRKEEQSPPHEIPQEKQIDAVKADIMKEISEISDEKLDVLLDMPEKKETAPKTTNEAIKSVFTAARDRAAGKIPSAKQAKALDDILADVAKEGIEGAGEALKGLYELFGGASLKTFPGGFDEETYAKAKPHFEAALEHFIKVGKGLREFAESIVKQFGDAVRPYLKQFIQEKRDGLTGKKATINLDENTGKGEGGARTRRKLTEQEKAEKKAKREAAAEKKTRKAAMGEFKNVGYVYDPEKLNQKTKDKIPKSAAKIILDEMVPGKIWTPTFTEEATPGTVRLMTQMQKYFFTFKEYLTESRERLRYSSGKSIDDKIQHWLTYRGGSIDMLKGWATEYGKTIQPIVDAFNGQTSITNVIGKLQDTLLPGERFGDTETGTFARHYTEINSVDAKEKFAAIEGLLGRSRQVLYSFLTDSWHNLIADENDILLSEIDINKRGRNKTVVRSGLPDYREGIELKRTEDFQTPFGFKGVGFGEEGWINQEERNRVIPAAFDSFKDLAATIGAPDKGMSLGGELAVQFANLGHKAKGAAAAYFPSVRTINFTRDSGDGTMAHEWGHGIHDLASEDAKSEINAIISTFQFVYDFDAGTRLIDDLLAKDSMFLKRMVSSKKQQRIEAVKNEVTNRFEDTVRKSTDYFSTAQQMDADYTARAQEMWARAFEAYIYDTLAGKNNYLVNDFVAAGRVGGKAGVGTRLVYPSGKERETFNATIKHLLDGLVWDESGKPSLKSDYITIEKANELMLQLQLKQLLDQVEARYTAIWASEPSKDGYFWYRYDETSFGPMMQPDGYDGYDKAFTSEGQNGTGAVAYLTQLHPDDILDYKLSNILYEGENPTYIAKERGGINGSLSEDGTEALEEVSAEPDGGPGEGGDVRSGDRGSGADGEGGTRTPGKQRGATGSSEGDSAEGVHPSPAGNYRITDPTLNDPKSVPVRFGLNLSAVKVLNLVESENRTPTDAEKDILAQYSGWGGMSELFAYEPSAAWAGKAELLKAELTDDEIRDAASSSTSSYYTPVPVGQFMWKLAQRLGFEKGVVLDPATGANGLFLGTMPLDLAHGVTLQAIEMDTLSARIASKLYGLASIETKAFQDVKKPNNRFDLTITNVPFENITPTDLKHNKGGHKLHNYFINKMLNLTAPGALSMMITTSNTLDTVGTHLTEFSEKAHFVGAIRLPSGIYSATQVATDILVFRKKIEGGKFVGVPVEEWTTAGEDESTGLTINNYFLKHPEMVAGKLEKITGRYGNEHLRVVSEGDLQANLKRIAAAFPDKIVEREAVKEAKSIDDIISAPGTIKEGGAYINEKDEVCEKIDGEEVKMPVATASEQKKAAIARGFVHILDQVRATLRSQKTETNDAIVRAEQTKLKKYYDHFVKKFGPINDPKNSAVFSEFTDAAWVIALEEYDPDTGKVTKIADIFTKNITGIASRPDRAETDHDALAMALDEFGYPNLEYMARLRNSDVDSVRQGVADKIVENPETGFLETMDEYLSGNVKRKLAIAREMAESNPEYARNVSLLEAAQPPEIPQNRITARIGASWISPEHLADFVKDKMGLRRGLRALFNFNPVSNEWSMSFAGEERYRGRGKGFGENKAEVQRQIAAAKRSIEATKVWGTERLDFFELIKCALLGKRPQVTYTVDRKQYLDEVATQAAEVKLQDIQNEFGRWLFADTIRADEAVKRFNNLINTSVPMKADGSHLTFPGKSMWMVTPKEKEALGITDTLTFYPHQMNATWKYLKNGNLYLGHEVGTGKTVTMALIAMEAKRLRGKKKVLYVTLNDSTMGQAVQEIKNLYPMANVLPVRVSTNEQRKQRALQKLALNDFDIAIMRQQDLDRIGLSPESERVFIEEEIQELREILEEAKREGARILEQDIQVQLHALEEKLKAPSVYDEAKKKNLFFDDLGIDLMIVDEAHKYKNIPYATRLTRITGLNPTGSPTAKDFFRKTQYLNAQFPKKDSIVLASGTALSNSIAEMYNIQRMLQPQEVKRQGVWSFDRWIANHGDMGSQMEWDGARGQYKVITTNRRIVNAGRLLATAYQNVDSVRADDTPVKRPIIRGGEPQRVKVQPNQYVEDYKRIVLERCAAIEADPKNAEFEGVPDNMLRIISNMSKVAIDQRLDHHYANTEMQQDSKIAAASAIMYRRWQEEAPHKGVQLVFADMGIPGKYSTKFKYKTEDEISKLSPEELADYNEEKFEHESASAGFNTYEGLKKELVKLGIPEKQIAFIHDADHTNKEKKAANLRSLFRKVNAGDIRVLIGSTSKAGTGVNIQGRVSDIHHLDVWWNFSAWEQRNGRGIRAGNLYANEGMPGTYIWNYVTETTVDATRWDKVFAKGKVLNAVLGGDINLDVIEDISDETMSAKMMAAEASGDPLMATQATLLQEVQGLRFEQAAYLDVVRRSRMELAEIPGRVEALEKCITDYQHSRDIMGKVTAVRFVGDERTLVLEKHGKEIAEALEKAVKADTGSWSESKKAPLLVFGSHSETEVVEIVEGKDGEKKEKKVKKYSFSPLAAKADITGEKRDPYGRRLLVSGDILSSDRKLADIKIDKDKKAAVDVKANVSRTVTEFLKWLNNAEKSANDSIAELKGNEPKLQKVIDAPWGKVDELATKDEELRDIEAKMAARGVSVGDPTVGIPIDKYKGIVPVLEDVAEKGEWSFYNGIVYPYQNATIGVRGKTDLSRYLKSGKLKPHIASQYNAPDSLSVMEGGKPNTPETKPIAYTVIENVTKFWVPAGTTFVTVDPVEWNLLKRIIGEEGSWHYDDQGLGNRYIVHVNSTGERDAFIVAQQESYVPQGVKDIGDKKSPVFSRGARSTDTGGRMPVGELERYARQLMGDAKNQPELVVVEKVSDLPFDAPDDAKGVLHGGVMYLVSEQIALPEDANEAIFHEFVGHFGLRGFFGDGLNAALDRIHVNNPLVRKYTNEWMKDNRDLKERYELSDLDYHYRAIEEAMARMAQENKPFSAAKRLLTTVQSLLRKIGLTRLADTLEAKTNAEALAMLHKARLYISKGRTIGSNIPEPLYPYFMTAWHGSPHTFARFDTGKIGTGEGAQAYGHGLYFAGKKEVADYYRRSLANQRDMPVQIPQWAAQQAVAVLQNRIYAEIQDSYYEHDINEALNKLNDWAFNPKHNPFPASYLDDLRIEYSDVVPTARKGRLYKVELAPEEDEYLQWDMPLSKQSEKVKTAILRAGQEATGGMLTELPTMMGSEFYHLVAETKIKENGAWEKREYGERDFKAASDYLHSLGIRGIKYLDAASRGKGEGHYNYVIFSDKDVSITEMYSVGKKRNVVTTLTGKEISGPDYFESAREYYKNNLQGKTLHREEIGDIRVAGKGWKKAKRGAKTDELKAKLFPAIPDVIERGQYHGREAVTGRKDDIVAFHYFDGRVDVGGNPVQAGATVAEDSRGNLFYNINHDANTLWEKRKARHLPRLEARGGEPSTEGSPSAEDNITENDEAVNIIILSPGQAPQAPGWTLADVQEIFKGQEVQQLQSGAIAIQTRGGQTLVINAVDSITPDRVSLRIGYGTKKLKEGQVITGAYYGGRTTQGLTEGVIELNRLRGDTWTLAHESIHFLEDAGIINAEDVAILKAHIRTAVKSGRMKTVNAKDIGGAEDRANFLADALAREEAIGGLAGVIVARIRKFLDRLVEAFGIRTAGAVTRDVRSGAIFEREGAVAGTGNQAYSTGKYDHFGDEAVTDFSQDDEWHDIAYREPTKKAIARLNAWLKENPYATIRMYHGTDGSIPIMQEGLRPTSARTAKSLQSSHGTVSLSIFPGMAHQFGRLAYPGKEIAVYPVDVQVRNLVPDRDQLRNKRHFGGREDLGDTLAESIAIGHGAKVRGEVPVEWIRVAEEKPSLKAYEEALSAHPYISRRVKPNLSAQEKTVRDNAYGVKGMDPVILDNVAKEMAALIPNEARKSAILVPIPGHSGDTSANVALAERIAAITGSRVADVLRRQAGQSQRDARVAGRRTMKPAEFGMVSTEPLDGDNVFFVDNVISSGATIRAARDAVGGGKGLVYAKSNPKGEKYAIGRLGAEQGIAVYEHLPVFAVTENGLKRKPRRANKEELSNGQEISGTAMVRADDAAATGQRADYKRKIPAPGGRVLPYVPERGTLPAVKSEPIGTWKSSRRKITSLEDAAVIARDNLFRDAQEVFVTIVTDKSGKILAINQHATGAPNQSQVYAYFAAGQILNIKGASRVWTVHNHPSGQPKLSEADLSVSANIGDLVADAGIENMPIIAITPSRYSENMWSSDPIPPREPAIYKLPLLGRKFDQLPEGLASMGSTAEFEEFGRSYMKEGGMVLVSAQRQPVALIAIDDYSKLRPLHTEILREAEKRNAVDFMIYSPDKALSQADIDNLLSFAKNTQLEFTTVRDSAGDHYERIKELWGAVRNSRERKIFYSVQNDATDNASMFPEVNERLKAARGVKYASLKDRAKDALVTGWEHFTRHFQHLEPETDGAVIDVFRKFQDVPAWAKDETVRRLSGFVGRLSPRQRDVFTMNILLPDMIRDIDGGTLTVDDEEGLPFGYKNRDQIQRDYDHFKAIAEKSTAIMEALDRRNAFMASLTDQLIQHKLLEKKIANDPAAYFHHQVLAYMNYKKNPNWGMSSQDVRTHRKGWQVGRKGSQLDYNTEYVESEFEIISQALTQIETVKSLKEIERLADIKPELEAEARDKNMATFREKAMTNPLDDPLQPYRTKIAMGFQKLAKLFTTENDMPALPMEFDDVIEHIVDQEEQRRAAKEDEIEFDPAPHPRMFALLNYLINHGGPGSIPAAMIFKAIAARNAFIKQVVGKDWITYRDLIPEGYVVHKPETGSTFYFTNSIADQALSQVLAGHKNLPEAVRQVLARGRDEEWVVKEGISKTLNEFRPALSDSLPAKMSKGMLTTWKQWILMNPFRVIKYNINNMSGDLDIAMAYDPKIITGYFMQAFKDLWAASKGNASEALMEELSALTKRGVVGSGMTAMDIPELGDVKSVKGLVDFFDGKSKNALSRWWSMSKRLSTLRENILRLAANRYFLYRLGRGEIVYGASRKEEIDAIESREDKAAKLARELIGDYGNISHAGQYIRERMIPFYSWLEINAPRYVRLFRNLRHDGGGGIGAMGGVLAWKTTKLAVKASALMGLVMLWNAAFFPDEEDELQETGREQLHMILGRRADGSIMTLRFQGALSDALSWFGMSNPVEQARKIVSGTKGVGDLARDVGKAAPLRLFQGFRPEPKLLYETLSGQSFFPDPLHPRPIRDTTEHILRTFSLDRLYNQAAGKPKEGGSWATQMYRDIQSLALNDSDPGEQAYYTSRKYIFDWLDKQGKEKPVAMPTNRSNSLYYYKQALKFGDFDAAEKYLKKYQEMGGKLHDVQGSIKRVHPLASLRLADRYKFKASLSPEQRETLSLATAWYKKHYVDTYREQRRKGMQ